MRAGVRGVTAARRGALHRLVLVGALVGYALMAGYGSAHTGATFDEPAHITAGVSYWRFNDYRLNPENGNWPQRLIALPDILASTVFPSLSDPAWRDADMWTLSDQLVFQLNDANATLSRSRLIVTIAGMFFGYLLFAWSYRLFGPGGGWVTLVAFTFSPTMLAHGALATSDLMGALALVAATWACWRTLHDVSVRSVAASAVAVSAAILSKMSGILIVPVAIALIVANMIARAPMTICWRGRVHAIASLRSRVAICGSLFLIHFLIAWLIVWATYGFRYSAFSPSGGAGATFIDAWPSVLSDGDLVDGVVEVGRAWHVLPEGFLYGVASVNAYGKHRASFLNGTLRTGGTPWFFPYAALVKTTLPLLLIVLGVVIGTGIDMIGRLGHNMSAPFASRISVARYEAIPLLALIAIYGAVIVCGSLNIGHRHMLPLIAAGLVLLGAAGSAVFGQQSGRYRASLRYTVPLLLLWHAGESISISPHYLAYFNQLAGGPRRGYEHLVDSSLDWGQDLPALREWLTRYGLSSRSNPPAYLAYFGRSLPSYYGVDARTLPGFPDRSQPHRPEPFEPGVYCISATMLQGVYASIHDPWAPQYVHDYNATLDNLRLFDSTGVNPATRAALLKQTGEAFWVRSFQIFEELRFARLASILRKRAPDAQAGYSILVYRVGADELRRALEPKGEP